MSRHCHGAGGVNRSTVGIGQTPPMEIVRTHTFDHPIESCWEMVHDPESHIAKFEGMGHRDLQVISVERTDTSLRLVVDRLVDVDVPGFAKKVIKPTNKLRSTDEWRDNGDGTYSGTYELDTIGVPIQVGGTTSLVSEGGGTIYQIVTELKVNVPIIGGRIASYSKGVVERQLDEEFRLGDAWLDSH